MKNKIKLIRKTKYYFFKYGIHRLFPASKLNFLGQLSSLSRWISGNRDLKFSSFPPKTFNYNNRFNLYKFVIENEISNESIDYLEFGVYKGESFRDSYRMYLTYDRWIKSQSESQEMWRRKINWDLKHSFYAFDTFEGMPEKMKNAKFS